MIGDTKSVGTSTSLIEPISTSSSPTRSLSLLTIVERSQSVPRPIGFFPSYLSDSITETNASVDGSNPPPYPVVSVLDSQDPAPYPLDELPYEKNLPPYPLGLPFPVKIHSAYPSQEHAGPSAPTIYELNHKIGLTPSEREEIIETLLQMKRTVEGKTESERTEFSDAQRKLRELLIIAQTRLTEADKDEFINQAKKIKKIRNERLEQEKQERLRKAAEKGELQIKYKEEANDCYCDLWSIAFKGLQLGMVILIYAENKKLMKDDETSTHLLILLCFASTMFTSCLFIFYIFGRKPSRTMLESECVYCGLCTFAFSAACLPQVWTSIHVMLFGIGAIIGYSLDIIRILSLLEKK